jgi:hypothetical protein
MSLKAVSAKRSKGRQAKSKEQHDGKDFFVFRCTYAQQLDDLDRRRLSFS